jgi:uncharacterized protein (TIGR02466 family)
MSNYEITPLFPETILKSKIDCNFTKEELNFIKNLPLIKNDNNSTSIDNYILNNSALSNLKNNILQAVKFYFYEILKSDINTEIYITQSWVNFTKEHESHHRHSHPNSVLSGIVYIDVDSTKDSIVFYKNMSNQIVTNKTEFNIYNSDLWTFPVETSQIIVFPSYLQHSVNTKEENNTRISLSFNTFIKGKIGNNVVLTELVLN